MMSPTWKYDFPQSPTWKYDFPQSPTWKAYFPSLLPGKLISPWFPTWKAATARGSAEGSPNPTSSLAILNTEMFTVQT